MCIRVCLNVFVFIMDLQWRVPCLKCKSYAFMHPVLFLVDGSWDSTSRRWGVGCVQITPTRGTTGAGGHITENKYFDASMAEGLAILLAMHQADDFCDQTKMEAPVDITIMSDKTSFFVNMKRGDAKEDEQQVLYDKILKQASRLLKRTICRTLMVQHRKQYGIEDPKWEPHKVATEYRMKHDQAMPDCILCGLDPASVTYQFADDSLPVNIVFHSHDNEAASPRSSSSIVPAPPPSRPLPWKIPPPPRDRFHRDRFHL